MCDGWKAEGVEVLGFVAMGVCVVVVDCVVRMLKGQSH